MYRDKPRTHKPRTAWISIRVNASQKRSIQAAAQREMRSVSGFLLDMALAVAKKDGAK